MPPRFLATLAIAACLFVHAPSLSYQLVWDDIDSLVQNNLGCERATECFTVATSGTYYRPIFAASMAEGYAAAERDPFKAERAMHWQNLGLFGLELLAVLVLFSACFGGLNNQAILAMVVFAMHPIQASASAWVTGRADLLPPLFAALAVGAWVIGSRQRAGLGLVIAGVLAFGLAVFSKEQAAPLVLLGPVLFRTHRKALLLVLVSGGALIFAWALINRALLASAPPIDPGWSGGDHLSVVVRTIAHSVRLLLLPLPSTLHRITAAPWGVFEVSELTIALVGVGLWLTLGLRVRQRPGPSFLFWLWASVTVVPVLNLVPLNLALGPYRLILPLVGVAGLVGSAIKPLAHWATGVVTFAVLSVLLSVELPNWRSDATLATIIVEADPENVEWLMAAARELKDRGQLEAALELSSSAVTTLYGEAKTAPELVARAARPDFRRAMGEHSSLRRQVFWAFHGAGVLCFRSTILHELKQLEAEAVDLEACTQISFDPEWKAKLDALRK